MGIKHFWYYLRNTYTNCITSNEPKNIKMENINTLMFDLNGIFHNSARKIYKTNENTKHMKKYISNEERSKKTKEIYEDINKKIEEIIDIVKPQKRIIFCIDGPAPLSKQNQQRQRRYRSAYGSDSNETSIFNSASISPGTKFLHYIGKNTEDFIYKNLSQNFTWKDLEIIFSNEKTPGEGEAKCFNYIRYYGDSHDSYVIYGNDADLIMLSLCCKIENFYILREDMFDINNLYIINIKLLREALSKELYWESDKYQFSPKQSIIDFIFLCFIVGNDFLPHIPSIEIISGGINLIINIYKEVCESEGHITDSDMIFIKKPLSLFFKTISLYEKELLEKSYIKFGIYPDELLDKHIKIIDGKCLLNIDQYKKDYYTEKMTISLGNIQKSCDDYLEGMQWVLTYYTKGVSNWLWLYPYHYAPFASDLCDHSYKDVKSMYYTNKPLLPFQQLLCILPPASSYLLPQPLNDILTKNSSVKKYYPENIVIDVGGKMKEWQGIVILPQINLKDIMKEYHKHIGKVNPKELHRNKLHKSVIYNLNNEKINKVFIDL